MRRLVCIGLALGLVVAASPAQDEAPHLAAATAQASADDGDRHGAAGCVFEALAAHEDTAGEADSGDPEAEHDPGARSGARILRLTAHGAQASGSDSAPELLLGRGPPRV